MSNYCQENIEKINLYLDNELDENSSKDLLAHFELCPDCKELYLKLKNNKENLSKIKITIPFDISKLVVEKIKKKRSKRLKILKYSSTAVAACLVLTFSLVFISNNINKGNDSVLEMSNDTAYYKNSVNYGAAPEMALDGQDIEFDMETDEVETETKVIVECMALERGDDSVFDYDLSTNEFTLEELEEKIQNNYNISDFEICDNCVVFYTDEKAIKAIIESFNLTINNIYEISDKNNFFVRIQITK